MFKFKLLVTERSIKPFFNVPSTKSNALSFMNTLGMIPGCTFWTTAFKCLHCGVVYPLTVALVTERLNETFWLIR